MLHLNSYILFKTNLILSESFRFRRCLFFSNPINSLSANEWPTAFENPVMKPSPAFVALSLCSKSLG